jgi:hypothetical protein
MKLPAHTVLFIAHNAHKDDWISIREWCKQNERKDYFRWRSEESKQDAIATNELWTMQWSLNSPLPEHQIVAPSIDELLSFAAQLDAGESK